MEARRFEANGTVLYYATRHIAAGEELLVDYGHRYFARADRPLYECGLPPLHLAAGRGDAERVRSLLEQQPAPAGADPARASSAAADAEGPGAVTPLQLAVQEGRVEVARVLLELGASVDKVDPQTGCTPLAAAVFAGPDPVPFGAA